MLKLVKAFSLAVGANAAEATSPANAAKAQEAVSPKPRESLIDDDAFEGTSQVEAAILVLRERGEPLLPTEIIAEFRKHDLSEMTGENASFSLIKALTRRAKNTRDVFKVPEGGGRWDLVEHYEASELAAMLSSVAASQEIAKERQRERTKEGLARARARGKTIGSPPKLNREQAIQFKEMLDRGVFQKVIAKHFGVSTTTVNKYKNKLKDWNEDDPYPPPAKEKPSETNEQAQKISAEK